MGQDLAHERGGVWGTGRFPTLSRRRGYVGETWFPPRTRAEGERWSFRALEEMTHELLAERRRGGPVARHDEDRVVARERACDAGMAGLVDRLGEGVRVAGRGHDDDEVARRLRRHRIPAHRRAESTKAVGVGRPWRRVDQPTA